MLRVATDADVHGAIIRGLRRRAPGIDLVRIQDVLSEGTLDPDVLDWTSGQNRILISNDRQTMVDFACQHVAAGKMLPGLIVTNNEQSVGAAIDDILMIVECMTEEEVRNQIVVYLPFG